MSCLCGVIRSANQRCLLHPLPFHALRSSAQCITVCGALQLPVEEWHAWLGDPTLADAILDRLVHNAYRLTLRGESMRKQKSAVQEPKPATR